MVVSPRTSQPGVEVGEEQRTNLDGRRQGCLGEVGELEFAHALCASVCFRVCVDGCLG
jgi:hypothetical protein